MLMYVCRFVRKHGLYRRQLLLLVVLLTIPVGCPKAGDLGVQRVCPRAWNSIALDFERVVEAVCLL